MESNKVSINSIKTEPISRIVSDISWDMASLWDVIIGQTGFSGGLIIE